MAPYYGTSHVHSMLNSMYMKWSVVLIFMFLISVYVELVVTEIVCFVTVIVLLHLRLGLHCQFLGMSFLSVSGSFYFGCCSKFSPSCSYICFLFSDVLWCSCSCCLYGTQVMMYLCLPGWLSVSKTFFFLHGTTPRIIFHILRNPHL